jgi:hypothetical protein
MTNSTLEAVLRRDRLVIAGAVARAAGVAFIVAGRWMLLSSPQ